MVTNSIFTFKYLKYNYLSIIFRLSREYYFKNNNQLEIINERLFLYTCSKYRLSRIADETGNRRFAVAKNKEISAKVKAFKFIFQKLSFYGQQQLSFELYTIINRTNMQYSDKIKLKVLKYSLRLEKIASHSLGFILDVEDPTNTKSLGNKNTPLAFNQKLHLLLDSGSIDKKEKEKMEIFMEVRNQFMHNLNVNSFIEVFAVLTGRETRLRKLYPSYFSDEIEVEDSLNRVTEKLYLEGMKILMSFKGARESKMKTMTSESVFRRLYEATPNAIDKALKMLVDDIRTDSFHYKDKEILIENIELLKKQILVYQQID